MQVKDSSELEIIVADGIAANAKDAAEVKMGKANPAQVNELLKAKLN